MLATAHSAAVYGVDAYPVEIEVNVGGGDPSAVVVGLPDAAVRESRDRVYTAVRNSGFKPPKGRTTINLAPANMKKEGPVFDLPIAAGMLQASGEIQTDLLDQVAMIGELALSGEVRRARGVLPIALSARQQGLRGILTPADNAEEAAGELKHLAGHGALDPVDAGDAVPNRDDRAHLGHVDLHGVAADLVTDDLGYLFRADVHMSWCLSFASAWVAVQRSAAPTR